jgi:hypothetical protein
MSLITMKRELCNPVARHAISGALSELDRHYRRLERYNYDAGYLDGFQRIRRALWRLRLSLAGVSKNHDGQCAQVKALAFADGALKRELTAAKLDEASFVPVQEKGKPLRYIKAGPCYWQGACAAYRVFKEHCAAVVQRKSVAVG